MNKKKFLLQLLPIGLLITASVALKTKYGMSYSAPVAYVYSCLLGTGASVGTHGFAFVSFSHDQVPLIGSSATLGNHVMGCN